MPDEGTLMASTTGALELRLFGSDKLDRFTETGANLGSLGSLKPSSSCDTCRLTLGCLTNMVPEYFHTCESPEEEAPSAYRGAERGHESNHPGSREGDPHGLSDRGNPQAHASGRRQAYPRTHSGWLGQAGIVDICSSPAGKPK